MEWESLLQERNGVLMYSQHHHCVCIYSEILEVATVLIVLSV